MQFRINIIDDEKNLNDLVRTYLEKEGYIVYSFYTYDEALMHKDDDVHLWLIDIMLDRASGFELFNEIKASRPKMPIIFMSARDQEFDRIIGLEKGSDDYITKPFSLMVLRARVRALLRRNSGEQKSEYRDKVFQFCFDTMKFYKEGNSIELSKTEQRILYLLVFNSGQILTRERLLEWVWPDGTEYVEDNALSVGIRRLRDKLEDVPSKPAHIKTVYGKGYMWENAK